ncbi:aminotransferase class V-fold PLP-dependent enzyme [Nonlabens ulvanivorans]|uniref:Selenocysteine lyase/cysteine desulfurase n=1 Tax=Nonlabens ulvanivorans TaxID=906888 RepID=A0ABX5E6M6_NONUL|nr:aminotransferase class V-fold PLP-dependent enzyme [Nonlabens ulvanivorans]PRX14240.1 selenocysteine lyase/cysteine desulfurase [Nonlabens ulvanivorans]
MLSSLYKKQTAQKPTLLHDTYFNDLRRKEYSRLCQQQHTYLDFTGGNLYAQSQLDEHQSLLRNNVLGNPHSGNPSSLLATQLVQEARDEVLTFFNASEDYQCVFTQNASGALKIVGECYPHNKDSHLLMLADNHNSVHGMREYCSKQGGSYSYAPLNYEDLMISDQDLEESLQQHAYKKNKLFTYPAQSNVSGVKHDLEWINKAQSNGWDVCLDAAAYVPSSPLDLKKYQPEFVAVSFYKIFGYPTGLGCLLIKKSAFHKLEKKWFAGGTVQYASVSNPFYFLADDYERFENGTISYLDIPAVTIGLNYISKIGMQRINERITSMTKYLYQSLKDIRYNDGSRFIHLFGPSCRETTGGTIIMNFFNPDGALISVYDVEEKANLMNISLRSGCFCNPGIDELNNHITNDGIENEFYTSDNSNRKDLVRKLKNMRGATRVSVGIATTQKDLDYYVEFVKSVRAEFS